MGKVRILLPSLALMAFAASASAGVVYDHKGNQAFTTQAECNQAIADGTAKFYKPLTFHKPKLRTGESSVEQTTLSSIFSSYEKGACDLGTGHRGGRDGVAKILQGKYVPYSPNMQVNAYFDKQDKLVRISMRQCDNWFSGNFPEPFIEPQPAAENNAAIKPSHIEPTSNPVTTPAASVPAVVQIASAPVATTAATTAAASVPASVQIAAAPIAGAAAAGGAVSAAVGSISLIPVVSGLAGLATVAAIVDSANKQSGTIGTTGTTK